MRSDNCARWTGGDTTIARPATISDGLIRRQLKRGQNLREEKPGPEPLIDKHGAFAVPAEASLRGMIAFQHGPSVDIAFLLSAKAAKKLVDPVQLCPDYIMIIFTPCVSRDPARSSCRRGPACRAGAVHSRVGRVSLKIIQCQSNDRLHTRQNLLRIATFFLAALHVIHLAVRAVAQPFAKVVCMRRRVAGGHATGLQCDL